MPETIRQLYDAIIQEGKEQNLSGPQRLYSVGWIFHDLFERAVHDEKKGIVVTAEHFDRYAAELPDSKIRRDIDEAQEEFGRVAAAFMEEEIKIQIQEALDSSILSQIKSYTSGWKTFLWNVGAGIMSGIAFAIILMIMGRIYEKDPSPIALEKEMMGDRPAGHITNPPGAPLPSPTQLASPEKR